MDRITIKRLERLVVLLNDTTGHIPEAYTKNKAGRFSANIGTYSLSQQYTGVGLDQVASTNGAVRTVFHTTTKRDLYNQIHAYLRGYREAKEKTCTK